MEKRIWKIVVIAMFISLLVVTSLSKCYDGGSHRTIVGATNESDIRAYDY